MLHRSVKENSHTSEKLLKKAKKDYAAFFKSFYTSPVAKVLVDKLSLRYFEVNKNFLKLFECRRKDVISRTPADLGFWADKNEKTVVTKAFRNDPYKSYSIDIKTFKGTHKNIIINRETISLNKREYFLGYIIDVTSSNITEKKLKESELKYSIVLNNTQNVIYEYSFKQLRYLYVSPSAKDVLGIKPGDFYSGKTNIITARLNEPYKTNIKKHYQYIKFQKGNKRKNFYIEYKYPAVGSKFKWLGDNHTVIYDQKGKPESIIGNISDITEKKKAQDELIKSYEIQQEYLNRITAIQDALPANIALIDNAGFITAVNKEWKKFAVRNDLKSKNYCIGENYLDVCRSADNTNEPELKYIYRGIKNVLNRKVRDFHMEYPCHSSREKRWFRFTVNPISPDKDSGAVLMHVNITEQKLAELRLVESEEQYKLLFYNNPLPMWIFDFNTLRILAVNNSAVKHYGYSKKEFLNMTIADIRPKSELDKYQKFRENVLKKKRTKESFNAGLWKHLKKNGEEIDVEINRAPVKFQGKDAVLVLLNDVTGQIKTNSQLKQKNEELNLYYNVYKDFSSTLNPAEIYNKIFGILDHHFHCDSISVSSFDKQTKIISCLAYWLAGKKINVEEFPVLKYNSKGDGFQSKIIRTGKPAIINHFDLAVKRSKNVNYFGQDGKLIKKPANRQIDRSVMMVPLKMQDEVIGVLSVYSSRLFAYTDADLRLLESLAAQISAATANALLFKKAQDEINVRNIAEQKLIKLTKEISGLYEISRDISSAAKAEEIYSKIFKMIGSSYPECDIGISILNESREEIELKALYTNGKEVDTDALPPIKYDKRGNGLQSSVIATKKSRLICNYKDYVRKNGVKYYVDKKGKVIYQKKDISDVAESALIVPLIYKNKVIGTMQLLNYSNSGFSDESIRVFESFASNIAVSYTNAQLYENLQNQLSERQETEKILQEKTKELEILYEAQLVLSGSLNIESIYDKIYQVLDQNITFHSMIISSYDEKDKMIKVLSMWAENVKPAVENFPAIPLAPPGKGIQSEVIRKGKPLMINNYKEYYKRTVTHYSYNNNKIVKEPDVLYNSALIVPMVHQNSIIGTIQLLSYKPNAYTPGSLRMLESLAGPISAATYNAFLYKQAESEIEEKQKAKEELALRNKEITLLYSAGRELLSTLDLEEVYDIFYRKVKEIITCNSMIIAEYRKARNELICKAAWVEDTKHDAKSFPPLKAGGNFKGTQAEAVFTGAPVLVNNFYDVIKERSDKYYFDEQGNVIDYAKTSEEIDTENPVVQSAMYIPMKIGRNVIGVISVFSYKKNAYTEYDLKILESITVHISVAAANAELYKQAQIEISERIKKEEELKQIRRNLEEAQRIAHIGSWVYDLASQRLYNSDELYRILGLKKYPEYFEFDEGMSHIYEDDRQNTIKKLAEAVKKKCRYENEDRIIRPDGEIRYVKIVGEPTFDSKRNFTGMQGTLQDITEVKRINDELVKSLNEKELILKEIHHRVKNNLQVVSSLLRLQSESIKDEAAIGYLKMSEQRVKSMALIHQQLYRTKDLSRIDFREYLEDLCNYLFFAYDISFSRVELKIEVEEIFFGIDTALPCGLIVNELVTNSIKHAFPDYAVGTLIVRLKKEATGKYILTIKDDGKGAEKLDFEKTSTLGMELVKTLTEQLEGEISVQSSNGTEITISFFDQYSDK